MHPTSYPNTLRIKFVLIICVACLAFCTDAEPSSKPTTAPTTHQADHDSIVPKFPGSLHVLSVMHEDIKNTRLEADTACVIDDLEMTLRFTAAKREDARIFITDTLGKTYKELIAGRVKPGFNEFNFNSEPLPYGEWLIYVTFDVYDDTVQVVRFQKQP